MSKHTPGKWKVGFNDGTGKSYITDPEGRVVVRGGFDSRGVKHGVLKASDARLIAAAPEMFSILQVMLLPNADVREVFARIEAVMERIGQATTP